MSGDDWRDLSDSEVRARLIHRGVDSVRAYELVNDRDDERTALTIDRHLSESK